MVPFPYGRLLVSPTSKDNLVDILPVRPILVLVVRSERKVDVVTCHHWGKQLERGCGVTFKEDLLVGPVEVAEFVAGDVDIESARRVVVVWTLKCLSLIFKASHVDACGGSVCTVQTHLL